MPDPDEDPVLISSLNHLLFCPRRFALIHIEGVFAENIHTLRGEMLHEQADTPGYETREGVRVVRALPLFSTRHGLSGKGDIVEFRPGPGSPETPCPVDYKAGKKIQWDNDEVQLCAQGLCLEDMFGVAVPRGAIFHGGSKRRREVVFDDALRGLTVSTIARARELLRLRRLPAPVFDKRCSGCSLSTVCLPELSQAMVSAAREAGGFAVREG